MFCNTFYDNSLRNYPKNSQKTGKTSEKSQKSGEK